MPYITVCTATYNRANTLHRPFQSLCRQTFMDFIWLVIDDGSKDNTAEVMEVFQREAPFSIQYIRKENGGRASALNYSYNYIDTELVINLDSDDALDENALKSIHDIWEGLSKSERDRYWCITGLCKDSVSDKIIGNIWPKDINSLTGKKQYRAITRIKRGEKSCCRKTEVLRQNPFPQYEDTTFVPEDIVWCKINHKYDQYCTNTVFRIYYRDTENSLSKGGNLGVAHQRSLLYLYNTYFNECFDEFLYNKNARWSPLGVCRQAIRTDYPFSQTIAGVYSIWKKILIAMLWGPIKLYSILKECKK